MKERKERKMDRTMEERAGGRGSVKKGKEDGGHILPFELPGPPCLFFFPLYFQNVSQLTRHLVPGCLMHLHKDAGNHFQGQFGFTGKQPLSPVSTALLVQGSKSQKCCVHAPGLELWRISRQKPGHCWPSTRNAAGGLLLLFVARHHMMHSTHQLPGQPIRESGLLDFTERGAGSTLRTTTGTQPCLPHCQPPRHCPHPSCTCFLQASPGAEEPDAQCRLCPRQHNAQLFMVIKCPQVHCSLFL